MIHYLNKRKGIIIDHHYRFSFLNVFLFEVCVDCDRISDVILTLCVKCNWLIFFLVSPRQMSRGEKIPSACMLCLSKHYFPPKNVVFFWQTCLSVFWLIVTQLYAVSNRMNLVLRRCRAQSWRSWNFRNLSWTTTFLGKLHFWLLQTRSLVWPREVWKLFSFSEPNHTRGLFCKNLSVMTSG